MILILSLTEYMFKFDMALPEIGLVTLSQCMKRLMLPCDALVSSQAS
jgi:hypothetical protein